MKELLKNLTDKEIEFVCWFANVYITQIPYICKSNVNDLNRGYFIKTLKLKIKQGKLGSNVLTYANIIISKNNLK